MCRGKLAVVLQCTIGDYTGYPKCHPFYAHDLLVMRFCENVLDLTENIAHLRDFTCVERVHVHALVFLTDKSPGWKRWAAV